ncbi:hypothetical protein PFISCL1PPCAC_17402, partial [Pristionchus fissidentatus]
LTDGKCDVIVQIRHYGTSKVLIMVEIKPDNATINTKHPIVFKQGPSAEFHCYGTMSQTGDSTREFTTAARSVSISEKRAFCSFVVEALTANKFSNAFANNKYKPTVIFTLQGQTDPDTVVFGGNRMQLWNSLTPNCDLDMATSKDTVAEGYHLSRVKDLTAPVITCGTRQFYIARANGSFSLADELDCASEWMYTV